jgi:hypothetical protein
MVPGKSRLVWKALWAGWVVAAYLGLTASAQGATAQSITFPNPGNAALSVGSFTLCFHDGGGMHGQRE